MNVSTSTYGLLDTGHGAKLEQVGPYRLIRPASQALWRPAHAASLWETADACFRRHSSGGGTWTYQRPLPSTWTLTYAGLPLRVKLTDFGHLGFFAEHGPHWQWLQQRILAAGRPVRVLNAFAYTGCSSLAAAGAGASVVHLDAADGSVAWARDNAQLAGLTTAPIRWVVEDVMKFLRREVRRGSQYDVMVLDPPSFGRGAKGEVWKLERDLPRLLALCRQLLSDAPLVVLLSTHTPGFTPVILERLVAEMMDTHQGTLMSMEMVIPQQGRPCGLPSGAIARWSCDTDA